MTMLRVEEEGEKIVYKSPLRAVVVKRRVPSGSYSSHGIQLLF